jgi:hypothetical protein
VETVATQKRPFCPPCLCLDTSHSRKVANAVAGSIHEEE